MCIYISINVLGRALREREEDSLRSSTDEIDRAKNLLDKIESRVESQVCGFSIW